MHRKTVTDKPHHRSIMCARVLRGVVSLVLVLAGLLWQPSGVAAAEGLRIAVAANFLQATKELTADFEKQTGI
ncbi:MAG: hypothetical protein LLG97_06940, partial [Deltaproteobacteria bacterium]|nr:hypothetical protein [Deltaproteobacteria bacterium]